MAICHIFGMHFMHFAHAFRKFAKKPFGNFRRKRLRFQKVRKKSPIFFYFPKKFHKQPKDMSCLFPGSRKRFPKKLQELLKKDDDATKCNQKGTSVRPESPADSSRKGVIAVHAS